MRLRPILRKFHISPCGNGQVEQTSSIHFCPSLSNTLSLHLSSPFSARPCVLFCDLRRRRRGNRVSSDRVWGRGRTKEQGVLVSRPRLHLVCWELGGDSASLVFSGLGAAVDVCTMLSEDLECIFWDGSCRDTKQNGGISSQSKGRELAANPQIDPHPLLTVQHGTSSSR